MSKARFEQQQLAELAKLEVMPDNEIDTVDIPEAPAENWLDARHGELYRPLKQPVTIRLDADVLAWFKDHTVRGGYQTEINRVLRQYVADAEKKSA